MSLIEFDKFITDFFDVPDRIPASRDTLVPPERYRLQRLKDNLRIDLPGWRQQSIFIYPSFYPADRGPHVSRNREQRFILEVLTPVLTNRPTTSQQLWEMIDSNSQVAGSPYDYREPENRQNVDQNCTNAVFVKYLTFQSFSRYLVHPEVPRYKKWGQKLKNNDGRDLFRQKLTDFIQSNDRDSMIAVAPPTRPGTLPNAMFLTQPNLAPHKRLPTGISIDTQAAARYVVKQMGLPGFEGQEDRNRNAGLLAIQIPARLISTPYRPTVFEAMRDGSYFFLPGPCSQPHGLTWPLTDTLDRNDPDSAEGIPEWIAAACPEFPLHEAAIEVVGTFD